MEKKNDQEPLVIVRWIDPDCWGFRAWSVLFALAKRAPTNMKAWLALSNMLPSILPCHTCRCCCAKFVKRTPPETRLPLEWLKELRHEIHTRNLKNSDCNRLDKCLETISPTDVKTDYDRFLTRAKIQPLWIMDAFQFLACVAMTIDFQKAKWTLFTDLVAQLSPLDLALPFTPTQPHTTVDQALAWLTSSPKCPTLPLLATLAHITVKTRELPN